MAKQKVKKEMSEEEHGVFWALKELFVMHPEGAFPFDRETFEEVIEGSTEN